MRSLEKIKVPPGLLSSGFESHEEVESHSEELISLYVQARDNSGPGALCISFTAETGNCDCYYITLDKVPTELKDKYEKKLKESYYNSPQNPGINEVVIIIFHDSDKSFVEGVTHFLNATFGTAGPEPRKRIPYKIKENEEN